jgi:hypothetical protein
LSSTPSITSASLKTTRIEQAQASNLESRVSVAREHRA